MVDGQLARAEGVPGVESYLRLIHVPPGQSPAISCAGTWLSAAPGCEETALAQTRENLRAEINMLSSYGRIQTIAARDLGLVHAPQQPYSLTVFGIAPSEPPSTATRKSL